MTLSAETLFTLFAAMFVMALLPSLSVATVVARSATKGFKHGVLTAAGIVLADVFFIMLVIFGLKLMADLFYDLVVVIAYLGGAYLIWLSVRLYHKGNVPTATLDMQKSSLYASFNLGFLLTLADQKAVLFYLAFFPAFLNLNTLSNLDGLLIISLAVLSVGLPKIMYAYLAAQGRGLLKPGITHKLNQLVSIMLFIIGVYLILKTTLDHQAWW